MEWFRSTSFVLFMLVVADKSCVYGGGTMTVEMMKYSNPGGRVNGGPCCDELSWTHHCGSKCDHFFTLCLEDINKKGLCYYWDSAIDRCRYGKIITGVVENADRIDKFGSTIGGTKNPMTFAFSSWPGGVTLNIYVEDHDNNSTDGVENLKAHIIQDTPAMFQSTDNVKEVVVHGRTRLTIRVRVNCDENFYGVRCDRFCKENEHYKCDLKTGQIICKPGRRGENCETHIIRR